MAESTPLDTKLLRNAFGSFATGVTVITTRGRDDRDYGLTANSFASVSLDPPLLLWCLGNETDCYEAFELAHHFAVHILAADQKTISNTFASKGADKFSGLEVSRGPDDIPLLQNFAARFICKTAYKYEGGDHIIHVGEVLDFSVVDTEPLVFHKGSYANLA